MEKQSKALGSTARQLKGVRQRHECTMEYGNGTMAASAMGWSVLAVVMLAIHDSWSLFKGELREPGCDRERGRGLEG
jgi:hypothetical protein